MAIRRLSKASITSGAKSSKMWDQETSLGYYESIATATVTGTGNTNIIFSNIPQNYTHLQLRCSVRSLAAQSGDNFTIYGFDGTGGNSNSATHILYGNGASAFSAQAVGQYNPAITQLPAASNNANNFGVCIVDILDYTSTNKYKVVRAIGGYDDNGSGYISISSVLPFGFGTSTKLSNLRFYTVGQFAIGSTISLYGIRG
jgi:hypothetical protein